MARRTRRISVIAADDHPVFLAGLERAMRERPELEFLGSAMTGEQALELIRTTAPDVAVLDFRLPGMTGIEIASTVTREERSTRIVLLSAYDESALVYDALAAGAVGYLLKTASRDEVCNAVLRVMRDKHAVSSELEDLLYSEVRRHSRGTGVAPTARELEVLALSADGCTTKQIAKRLHVTDSTVKSHFESIFHKLGARSRTTAVAHALRRNLLD